MGGWVGGWVGRWMNRWVGRRRTYREGKRRIVNNTVPHCLRKAGGNNLNGLARDFERRTGEDGEVAHMPG